MVLGGLIVTQGTQICMHMGGFTNNQQILHNLKSYVVHIGSQCLPHNDENCRNPVSSPILNVTSSHSTNNSGLNNEQNPHTMMARNTCVTKGERKKKSNSLGFFDPPSPPMKLLDILWPFQILMILFLVLLPESDVYQLRFFPSSTVHFLHALVSCFILNLTEINCHLPIVNF